MSNLPWRKHDLSLTLTLRVKPASRINSLSINASGSLILSLQAIAEDGQANKLLIKYLAKLLHTQQKKITIQQGMTSRNKVISIASLPDEQDEIIARLVNEIGPVELFPRST